MKTETVALAHKCRELFTVIDMTKALGKEVVIAIGETTIDVSIHEYNSKALILANNLPPQVKPRSKHYSAKTILFCE